MEEQIKAAEAEKEALKKKIEELERAKNGTATNGQAQNQVRLPGESHNCSDRLYLPYILGVEIWHAQISLGQKWTFRQMLEWVLLGVFSEVDALVDKLHVLGGGT